MKRIFIIVFLMFVFCLAFVAIGYSDWPQNTINEKLKFWREFIQKTPNARAYGHLTWWLLEDKQYEQSIAAAKKSISLDPFIAIVHYTLGDAYYGKEEYKKAILSYEKVPEMKRGQEIIYNSDIFSRIAKCYYQLIDFENAIHFFKKAINSNPNKSHYRHWLSWVYFCIGMDKEALAEINTAIEQSKYVGVGMRIGSGKKFPEIIEVFKDKPAEKAGAMAGDQIRKINGVSMKKKNIAQVVNRLKGGKGTKIKILVRRKKKKFKLVLTREAIGLPESEDSADMLSQRSLIYHKMADLEKAMSDAKQAIKMAPDSLKAKRAFGAVNIDDGKYEQAIEVLSKVDQEDTFVLILMAEAYAKQGDIQKAKQLYEEKIAGDESFIKKIPYINEQQKLFNLLALDTEDILSRAKQFEMKGEFQEALDEYSKGMIFVGKNKQKEIMDTLFRITNSMTSSPKISKLARKYALRAEVLVKEGEFKDSLLQFQKALQAAPYSANLYLNKALVYGKLEKYEQAIEQMRTYVQAAPQAPNIQASEDQIVKWEFQLEREKQFYQKNSRK